MVFYIHFKYHQVLFITETLYENLKKPGSLELIFQVFKPSLHHSELCSSLRYAYMDTYPQ